MDKDKGKIADPGLEHRQTCRMPKIQKKTKKNQLQCLLSGRKGTPHENHIKL